MNARNLNRTLTAMALLVNASLSENIVHILGTELETLLRTHDNDISDLVTGLLTLARGSGQLTPFLVSPSDLTKVLQNVRQSSLERKYVMMELPLYEYPISVININNNIEVLLHFPILLGIYSLLKFYPFPYYANGTYVSVVNQPDYLVLSAADDTRGVTMTQQELDQCKHYPLQDHFVCSNRLLGKSIYTSSCLGQLYAGETFGNLCAYSYRKQIEEVYLISADTLVVFTDNEQAVGSLYCKGSLANDRVPVVPGKLVKLDKGCKLSLTNSEYYSMDDFTIDMEYKKPLSLTVELNIPDTHTPIIETLLANMDVVTSNDIALLHGSFEHNQTQSIVFTTILAICLVLVLIGILVYCYGFCKHGKTWKDSKRKSPVEDDWL